MSHFGKPIQLFELGVDDLGFDPHRSRFVILEGGYKFRRGNITVFDHIWIIDVGF